VEAVNRHHIIIKANGMVVESMAPKQVAHILYEKITSQWVVGVSSFVNNQKGDDSVSCLR